MAGRFPSSIFYYAAGTANLKNFCQGLWPQYHPHTLLSIATTWKCETGMPFFLPYELFLQLALVHHTTGTTWPLPRCLLRPPRRVACTSECLPTSTMRPPHHVVLCCFATNQDASMAERQRDVVTSGQPLPGPLVSCSTHSGHHAAWSI